MKQTKARQESFAHVLWIGGPSDGGKTSLAAMLAECHGLQVFHFDRHEHAHFARVDLARHPALYKAHPDRMGPEERWLGSLSAAMARDVLACWSERCDMALDDLRTLPRHPLIVAGGPGFFPALTAPLIVDRRRAVWLLPTEAFKCASVIRRDKLGAVPTSDPARARENLLRRELLLVEQIRREVDTLGLIRHEIDGSRDLTAMLALIETQFAPWLAPQP